MALQAKPVLPLQVADFSGDQMQDIMLMTYDGLYGWAQVAPDSNYISVVILFTKQHHNHRASKICSSSCTVDFDQDGMNVRARES